MDRVKRYRELVKKIIRDNAALKPSYGEIDVEAIFDEAADHYELYWVGWDQHRRVDGAVIHVDIRDGKIWIQHDGTSPGIALELVDAGVPREHIVLGFRAPSERQFTDFAVS